MKKSNNNFWGIPLLIILGILTLQSCAHEDEDLSSIPTTTFEYGKDIVSTADGYTFDKSHSSVRWETAYLGSAAMLTGRFNSFEFTIDFDQDNPENTSLSGTVTLSTVNTGEPGRDEGCLLNTFDTANNDEATFVSTHVEKDGEGGYLINGDLSFHGVVSNVTGILEYTGTTFFDENSGVFGAPFNLAGFVVRFQMNAKSVFGIESGSISDAVTVIASGQFKQPQ